MPVEPPPSIWELPDPATLPPGQDLLVLGADLQPGTLLAGYRMGVFAMPIDVRRRRSRLSWWSPDPRGVLEPARIHVSRSMHRYLARYRVSIDQEFAGVLAGCADPRRPHGWISVAYELSYWALQELGWAHSIEVWDDDDRLVGGLLGVEVGGLFAGESMFHDPQLGPNASKVAMIALCEVLLGAGGGDRLVDVQWRTPHLATMGVSQVSRADYLQRLARLLRTPAAISDGMANARISAGRAGPADQRPSRIRWLVHPG